MNYKERIGDIKKLNTTDDNNVAKNDKSVEFLYGTKIGKVLLEFILFIKVPKLFGAVLRSPLSRFYIKSFIAKKGIDMSDFQDYVEVNPSGTKKFNSFNDFFTRRKPNVALNFDTDRTHLISPADSFLSVYKISEDSKFHIKGFDYTIEDFFGLSDDNMRFPDVDKSVCERFVGGDCLVFRLCATDYHRYCYIDDGSHEGELGKNHYIEGKLYSVQPLVAENFKLYTKNRRSWTVMNTENFGLVAQIEVGAFSVGGIVNHLPQNNSVSFKKGDEKGYFDLHGSTTVLLFEKGKIQLNDDVLELWKNGEVRVKYGQFIGTKV